MKKRKVLLPLIAGFIFFTTSIAALNQQDLQDKLADSVNMSKEEFEKALDKWANEYVRYIITDIEKREWNNLTSTEDKLRFIDVFWRRRDPKPDTPENEFRDEYMKRWNYVKEKFTAGKPGWRTDRGKIYLMLGAPSSVERHPFGRNRGERPSETWSYNSVNNKALPASIEISFVDFMGYGDYEIVTDLDRTAQFYTSFGIAMNNLDAYGLRREGELRSQEELLYEFKEPAIRHPEQLSSELFNLQNELREVAKVPSMSVKPITEKIKTEIMRGDMTFALTASAFKAAGSKSFLPVTISIPLKDLSYVEDSQKRSYQVELYARIKGEEDFDSFEDSLDIAVPLAASAQANDVNNPKGNANYLYQFWFSVPSGKFDISVTLRDVLSKTVGIQKLEIEVPAFNSGKLCTSDIVVADNVTASPENKIFKYSTARPFIVADRRVLPNTAREIPLEQESFFLFYHIYNFGLSSENGQPNLKLQYFIYRNEELFSKTPASYLHETFENRAAVETKFVTKTLGPGDFRIVTVITDEISGQTVKRECIFKILPPPLPLKTGK